MLVIRPEGLNIGLDSETLATLRATAHEQGIGPTTLVRIWIIEHPEGQQPLSPGTS